MQRSLSQEEIDSLIAALNSFKQYGDDDAISQDLLKNQIVLSQPEIDSLIDSLNIVRGTGEAHDLAEPDVRVVLSQTEIDSLVDALNAIREYDETKSFPIDIATNQNVLSQSEIDRLISILVKGKKD